MNIIKARKLWYTLSAIALLVALYSLFSFGLKLGIDFRGGQEIEVSGSTDNLAVEQIFIDSGAKEVNSTATSNNNLLVRYSNPEISDISEEVKTQIDILSNTTEEQSLEESAEDTETDESEKITNETSNEDKLPQAMRNIITVNLETAGLAEESFNSIGPSISSSIAKNAIISLVVASLAIIAYVSFAFRNAPEPVSPISFGVTAILAMLHDSIIILGIYALLGRFFNVEIDSLFVTAMLTVIGFSVHDTIVVFDRIRENLSRSTDKIETIVNNSVLQTLGRSINTSFTLLITLLALYIFGGSTISYFVLALILGVVIGTYSSIFIASPLLVTWLNTQEGRKK